MAGRHFTEDAGRSFKILDYSYGMKRNKTLKMSCIDGYPLPEMFTPPSRLSKIISEALFERAVSDGVDSPDDIDLTTRLQITVDRVMEHAASNLRDRMKNGEPMKRNRDMHSIIVINTGQEHVDKLHAFARKSAHFTFEGGEGFHLVRMTSLVKDDPSITSECDWKGEWRPKGNKGRIVNTTNFVASGLTVPNAAYVIDCGRQKIPAMYTRNGLRSLETIEIDRQMMIQRAGRTGRTTDGVYILPYSLEKVDEMVNENHGMLLRHRNFEERHFLLQKMHDLKLPHIPPRDLEDELLKSVETRGLFSAALGFDRDTLLMHSLMNFLSTENARIIIQGLRFGILAHVVYLVADSLCKGVKLCQPGTVGRGNVGGPSVDESAIHMYAEEMDRNWRSGGHNMAGLNEFEFNFNHMPEEYKGVGDSIALADLLVSYHIMKVHIMKDCPRGGNFWGGKWRSRGEVREGFSELKKLFVREEGECTINFYVGQITRHLIGIGILPDNNSVDDVFPSISHKDFNRHIVSAYNYCLNQDGRALLSALLTMHSSRVGKLGWMTILKRRQDRKPVYEIYCPQGDGQKESLHPEATYTHPEQTRSRDDKMYGRFVQICKRNGKYAGMIDPITLKQLAFFININGKTIRHASEFRK